MLPVKTSLALDADSPKSIRLYFEKVRCLAKSGNEYPVLLDEVWPLVYAAKDKAVRSLRKLFIEGFDFQVLTQNGENPVGGRPNDVYSLSLSCMEFFIARKVRAVFEVYREVFHRVVDMAEQAVHVPQQNLINQIARLEKKIDLMRKERVKHLKAKLVDRHYREQAKKIEADRIARDKVIEKFGRYMAETAYTNWNDLWSHFHVDYGVDIKSLTRYQGEHLVDVAVRYGCIHKVLEMLSYRYTK